MHAGWPAHRCPVCAKFRQAMLGAGCIARFPPSLQAAESGHSPAPTNPLTAIPGGPAGSKAEVRMFITRRSLAAYWRRPGGAIGAMSLIGPAAYMNEPSSLRGLCLGLLNPLPGCLGSAGSSSCGKSKLRCAVLRLGTGRPTAAGGILQPGTTPISLFLPHGRGPPIGKLTVRCGFSPS